MFILDGVGGVGNSGQAKPVAQAAGKQPEAKGTEETEASKKADGDKVIIKSNAEIAKELESTLAKKKEELAKTKDEKVQAKVKLEIEELTTRLSLQKGIKSIDDFKKVVDFLNKTEVKNPIVFLAMVTTLKMDPKYSEYSTKIREGIEQSEMDNPQIRIRNQAIRGRGSSPNSVERLENRGKYYQDIIKEQNKSIKDMQDLSKLS